MEHHRQEWVAPVNTQGSDGVAAGAATVPTYLQSGGSSAAPVWTPRAFLATDKAAQAAIGPVDLTWNAPAADAISVVTFNGSTQFTLQPNRLYKISVFIRPTVAAVAYTILICDTANNAVGSLNQPLSGLASVAHDHATAVFKPTVATAIKVRVTGGTVTVGSTSHIIIEQLD